MKLSLYLKKKLLAKNLVTEYNLHAMINFPKKNPLNLK